MRFITPFSYLIAFGAIVGIGLTVWAGVSFNQFAKIEVGGRVSECTPVIGITGAADIERVPGQAMAYMSSLDRRGDAERGAILRFDIDNPLDDASWRDRTGGEPSLFKPAGIDIYHAPLSDGRWMTRLFVVNRAGPEVVLFDVDAAGDLILLERFTDVRLSSPNDVVATGPRSFYVSNETRAQPDSWRRRVDFFFGLKTGQILEFDGTSWSDVADGLSFPNGLALSDDGQSLVLAEMRSKTLIRYDRDPQTDVLTRRDEVVLDAFPDNMAFDTDGHLIVGAVPQPLSFSAYAEGIKDLAPSMVLRVAPSGVVSTTFSDTGERLSGATVGVPLDDKLLIGSNAADRFLMCDYSYDQ